jgi:hypothetical protein
LFPYIRIRIRITIHLAVVVGHTSSEFYLVMKRNPCNIHLLVHQKNQNFLRKQ